MKAKDLARLLVEYPNADIVISILVDDIEGHRVWVCRDATHAKPTVVSHEKTIISIEGKRC